MRIISFSQEGSRAICIVSAVGLISNVTFRQSDSSGGTATYEGRFEILSLSGSFLPIDVGESQVGRCGGMSVSLASPDGRVIGGMLAGLLIAASPVQVVVASFLPISRPELKPKKVKTELKQTTATTAPSATPHTSNVDQSSFNANEFSSSTAENQDIETFANLQTLSWATTPTVQDSTKSATINTALLGDLSEAPGATHFSLNL
ncbi:unnamed protein product [Ilex paraguariensis]|uniref:AT-hook motif nuclear-localized protein n=1 Tax=Ilex paraguariensis TaxID=185542 RepID=A0ABC8SBD6_9AQUA